MFKKPDYFDDKLRILKDKFNIDFMDKMNYLVGSESPHNIT